jgi:nucleosome assembly protein 1-like 1
MSKGNKQLSEVAKGSDFGAKGGKAPFNLSALEDALDKPSIKDYPVAVQRRVRALKNIHKEHVDLEKKYRDEVAALERKYQTLYAPLYLKRSSIVNGEYEPTNEESHIDGEEELPAAGDKDKDTKGISNFWLTVFKNNATVGETVTVADEDALSYLQDVRHASIEGDKGFVLAFHFAENPYFSDTVLTKTYHLVDEDSVYGELVFDRAEGTKINWKPGKNLTVKVKKQQQKPRGGRGKRGGGAGRVTTVEEPCESFFHFFNPPSVDAEDIEEDEEGLLDDMLEADFEVGCIFKDKLIPHSVLWFTGEAQEFEDEFDDFDYEDEFDGDEDEDEEDEEDEDEEEGEEERPKKGRGNPPKKAAGRGGNQLPPSQKGGAPGQPQQPECKQQ